MTKDIQNSDVQESMMSGFVKLAHQARAEKFKIERWTKYAKKLLPSKLSHPNIKISGNKLRI